MNVKGFIIEDDQEKEFVLLCEQPFGRSGRTFSLRGWQRLRLFRCSIRKASFEKSSVEC
jgi:hypothetical protein